MDEHQNHCAKKNKVFRKYKKNGIKVKKKKSSTTLEMSTKKILLVPQKNLGTKLVKKPGQTS